MDPSSASGGSRSSPESDVYDRRAAHAGARHRREHGRVQRREWRSDQPASLSRARLADQRADAGARCPERAWHKRGNSRHARIRVDVRDVRGEQPKFREPRCLPAVPAERRWRRRFRADTWRLRQPRRARGAARAADAGTLLRGRGLLRRRTRRGHPWVGTGSGDSPATPLSSAGR